MLLNGSEEILCSEALTAGFHIFADYSSSGLDPDRLAGGIPATPMTGMEAPLLKSYNLRLAGKPDNILTTLTISRAQSSICS